MSKTTEIICILDRSGSMGTIMTEAMGALISFVDEQKKLPGEANFTLVAFDDQYEVKYNKMPLAQVGHISFIEPRGMTALYDAIGKAVNSAISAEKAIVLIQTDGQENSSREYNNEKIKQLIADREKAGWQFVFIGAGIDAFASGAAIGLSAQSCVNVAASAEGMRAYGSVMDSNTSTYRAG